MLGLPGSGKSTLTAALGDVVPGLRPATRRIAPEVPAPLRLARKGMATAVATARRPALSTALAADLGRVQQPGSALGRWVHWQQTQTLLRRARRASTLDGLPRLLDEGAFQCLWSAALRGDVEPLLARLGSPAAGRWERGDVVVVLEIPVVLAAERLAGRQSRHSRTQHLGPAEQLVELARGAALVDVLLERLTSPVTIGSVPPRVVRVDATASPDETAVSLASALGLFPV